MKVSASAIRKVGRAMKVSIRRERARAPGNGTKVSTSAIVKPSARQPVVASSAISRVCSSALVNSGPASTLA